VHEQQCGTQVYQTRGSVIYHSGATLYPASHLCEKLHLKKLAVGEGHWTWVLWHCSVARSSHLVASWWPYNWCRDVKCWHVEVSVTPVAMTVTAADSFTGRVSSDDVTRRTTTWVALVRRSIDLSSARWHLHRFLLRDAENCELHRIVWTFVWVNS